MLRQNSRRLDRLVHAFDLIVAALAFSLAAYQPGMLAIDPGTSRAALPAILLIALIATLAWPVLVEAAGLYGSQRRTEIFHMVTRIVLIGLGSAGLVAAANAVLGSPFAAHFSLYCAALQTVAIATERLLGIGALRQLRRRGRNYRNVLILGSGRRARDTLARIEDNPQWGQRVIGFVDDRDVPVDPSIPTDRIHKLQEVPRLLREQVVDELIVATPRSMMSTIEPVIASCAEGGVPVTLPCDLFGDLLMPSPRVTPFDGHAALSFAPVHHSQTALAMKRTLDIAAAGLLLAVAAPIIGVAALAIRMSSPGPIFFRQMRCGLHGRRFEMLKLRTMVQDAEQRKAELIELNEMDGPVFKIRNDPRVTPVGRWLRRWSIDELPQLWNVLRGDMSLVGPRPPVPSEVVQYATRDRRRLSMRPGLTCLWQVNGRNEVNFEDWVRLDLEYIDTWSLARDASILARTVPAVLRGTGAS